MISPPRHRRGDFFAFMRRGKAVPALGEVPPWEKEVRRAPNSESPRQVPRRPCPSPSPRGKEGPAAPPGWIRGRSGPQHGGGGMRIVARVRFLLLCLVCPLGQAVIQGGGGGTQHHSPPCGIYSRVCRKENPRRGAWARGGDWLFCDRFSTGGAGDSPYSSSRMKETSRSSVFTRSPGTT